MQTNRNKLLLYIGVPLLLCSIALLCAEAVINASRRPPLGITFSSLPAFLPEPSAIVRVLRDKRLYVVVFGKHCCFPIKEYPAGYIIDENGELVAWSAEASDTDASADFWNAARREIWEARLQSYDKVCTMADATIE